MPHIHWVERQNKLEIPKEKDEVNKREVHECDVRNCKILDTHTLLKHIKFEYLLLSKIRT